MNELEKIGHKLDKHYSLQNSLEELQYAYETNKNNFEEYISNKQIQEIKLYFSSEHELDYYVNNIEQTLQIFQLFLANKNINNIIKNHYELWNTITKIVLYFLRSDNFKKWIHELLSNLYIFKNNISNIISSYKDDQKEKVIEAKNMLMKNNYFLICDIKKNKTNNQKESQEMIFLLIKINSFISNLLSKIIKFEIQSEEELICVINTIKDFCLVNYETIIKYDFLYYQYVIPNIEKLILKSN